MRTRPEKFTPVLAFAPGKTDGGGVRPARCEEWEEFDNDAAQKAGGSDTLAVQDNAMPSNLESAEEAIVSPGESMEGEIGLRVGWAIYLKL